jgi:hypothetical protein
MFAMQSVHVDGEENVSEQRGLSLAVHAQLDLPTVGAFYVTVPPLRLNAAFEGETLAVGSTTALVTFSCVAY